MEELPLWTSGQPPQLDMFQAICTRVSKRRGGASPTDVVLFILDLVDSVRALLIHLNLLSLLSYLGPRFCGGVP